MKISWIARDFPIYFIIERAYIFTIWLKREKLSYGYHFKAKRRTECREMAGRSCRQTDRWGKHDPVHLQIPQGGHGVAQRRGAAKPQRETRISPKSGGEEGAGAWQHRGAGQAHGGAAGEDPRGGDDRGCRRPVSSVQTQEKDARQHCEGEGAGGAGGHHPGTGDDAAADGGGGALCGRGEGRGQCEGSAAGRDGYHRGDDIGRGWSQDIHPPGDLRGGEDHKHGEGRKGAERVRDVLWFWGACQQGGRAQGPRAEQGGEWEDPHGKDRGAHRAHHPLSGEEAHHKG